MLTRPIEERPSQVCQMKRPGRVLRNDVTNAEFGLVYSWRLRDLFPSSLQPAMKRIKLFRPE
jgi:hypothetical protein